MIHVQRMHVQIREYKCTLCNYRIGDKCVKCAFIDRPRDLIVVSLFLVLVMNSFEKEKVVIVIYLLFVNICPINWVAPLAMPRQWRQQHFMY
jgi:hypothetical protein